MECFHRFARLTDRPRIESVEVAYEGGSLPAYFVHAENTDRARTPCVVFDGLDITKGCSTWAAWPIWFGAGSRA